MTRALTMARNKSGEYMYHGYTLRESHEGYAVYAHGALVDTFATLNAARRFIDSLRAL